MHLTQGTPRKLSGAKTKSMPSVSASGGEMRLLKQSRKKTMKAILRTFSNAVVLGPIIQGIWELTHKFAANLGG